MARDLSKLSTTPASNDATGGFKTGMRPSSVKNAGWADESILAQLFNSLPVGGGTAAAQTLTNPVPLTALTDGLTVFMLPGAANGSGATFSPDGLTAEPIFANGAAVAGGEMQPTVPALLKYRLAVTAWELINPQPAGRNFFVDPCCRVAQGPTALALSTSYQYGQVDLVQCKAGGTVSAGTIVQSTAQLLTSAAGYGTTLSTTTLTGSGKAFFRRWIESRDTVAMNGKTVYFVVKCKQDTGGAINAFLTLNKFQSADSPGTPTLLASNSGAVTSVPTGTDTTITLAYTFSPSDGNNGVELILEMDCGAVTTKTFTATDWQAYLTTASQNCAVPRFEDDIVAVQRVVRLLGSLMGEAANASGAVRFVSLLNPPMLKAPSLSLAIATVNFAFGANSPTSSTAPSSVSAGTGDVNFIIAAVTPNPAAGNPVAMVSNSAILCDSRL